MAGGVIATGGHRTGAARIARLVLATLTAVVALTGCTAVRPAVPSPVTLRVLASTSLTDVMDQLRHAYETAHPNVAVQIVVGSDLALAVRAGAPVPTTLPTPATTGPAEPADVLVVEGPQPLAALSEKVSGNPVPVARNQLVIAVAPGNPRRISRLADLTRPGLRVAVCAPQEPCGALTAATLAGARVKLPNATHVFDVRAARELVRTGAADAALVYRTDTRAAAAGTVDTVEFSESVLAIITYQAAALTTSTHAPLAQSFVAFLASPMARNLFTLAGFQAPS
jgi:molybdate transport system substrate-binding protein